MKKNDIISLGNYHWQALEVNRDHALLITASIIDLRWYHHQFADVTWADCQLRAYLNGEFYQGFPAGERAKIKKVTNRNPDNQWFGTPGGIDTVDHIFLLSLDEVCQYFGDSRASLQHKGMQKWQIDDENNGNRQAKYNHELHWWRLRSPGYYGRTAASVSKHGCVYVRGNGVHGRPRDGGGLRPALWLTLTDHKLT